MEAVLGWLRDNSYFDYDKNGIAVHATVKLAKSEIRSCLRLDGLSAQIKDVYTVLETLVRNHHFTEFKFMNYYPSLQKVHSIASAILDNIEDDIIEDTETRLLELPLEISLTWGTASVIRNSALMYLVGYLRSSTSASHYLEKACEKIEQAMLLMKAVNNKEDADRLQRELSMLENFNNYEREKIIKTMFS